MAVSKTRVAEIIEYSLEHSEDEACKAYNIPQETFNRYKREYKKYFGENAELFLTLRKQYTKEELKAIASGGRIVPGYKPAPIINFDGEVITFGVLSDTHIGSVWTDPTYVYSAFDEMEKQGCSMLLHAGDLVEGTMGRPGHVYELSNIGYKAQKQAAIEVFSKWKKPFYITSGNHDCLKPDVECLTKRGWKTYNELLKDDLVYSYDTENNKARWMPINAVIVKDYAGTTVEIDSRPLSIEMTPSHRVLTAFSAGANKGKFFYEPASEIHSHGSTLYKVAASSDACDFPIEDDVLRVIGWLLTDGGIYRTKSTHKGRYTIYQSKNATNIRKALSEANLTYTERVRERNITSIVGQLLKKKPLPEHSFNLIGDFSVITSLLKEKKVPLWMYSLSKRQFDILCEVLKQANGSVHPDGHITKAWALYGTKELLKDFQALFVINGYRCWMKQDTRGAWKLNISDSDTVELKKDKIKASSYSGRVWCISTPLTNFLVRSEGTTVFTGNCSYDTKLGAGMDIVEDVCEHLGKNAHYLGVNEGNLIVNGAVIKLWHGGDGSSYALSYRDQKLIESFTGGEKPNILITGHIHKAYYFFYRNIHTIGAGSIQKQSGWMRAKKLQAHTGFWIVKACIAGGQVKWISPTWYPFYV